MPFTSGRFRRKPPPYRQHETMHAFPSIFARAQRWRFLGLIALAAPLLAALLLQGCTPDDPFTPTKKGTDTVDLTKGAFLRVIHAAADGPAVEVLVDGKPFFKGSQGYLDFQQNDNNARYYPVDSLAKRIEFRSAGTVLASDTLVLVKDQYYTAYFHGSRTKGYDALVTSDSIHHPTEAGQPTKYRVVNLSPDAPPFDIRQNSPSATPVISNLAYGSASQYVPTKEYFPRGTGMWIYDHNTGKEIRAITEPYIVLPPNATFTLVLTGNSKPRGEDAFLYFSVFQEDSKGSDGLYGATPFNISFAAVRFANLVSSGSNLLDVTFFDPNTEFCHNDNFRRNIVGQPDAMENVASLGLDGQDKTRNYFFVSLLVRQDFPYRVEYHQGDRVGRNCTNNAEHKDYRKQDVLVPRNELTPSVNKRYTIVAYGAYTPDSARAAVLLDNTPAPPPGLAQVRFFHGAFGRDYQAKDLRIRINGQSTPVAMVYGKVPDGTNSFATGPGGVTAEVIDKDGNVIHTQTLDNTPLEADKSYTIFLTRGPFGDKLYLHALAEEVIPK